MPSRTLLPSTLVFALALAGPALAQTPAPAPAKKPAAPARALVSTSPNPTLDEGTIQRISAALLSYSALEVQGGWPTLPASAAKLAPGAKGPDVALLRQRLAITEDLPADKEAGDVYDEAVVAAVKFFQGRHGLEQTGSIGPKTLAALNVPVTRRLRQLAASFDRLAATDFKFGQRYVVVNLPAAFVEAVEHDKVVRRHVVQVGRPDRPSPTVTTQITTVNLNPTWTVPLGILKKDVIPRMRKDPGYAARMHMKVLDGAGREVDAALVDWNSDRAPNFTIRQDSGNWNALGSVRIDMPNPYSVYMHDTNHKEFFSADYRFQSSGCTRVQDVRDLATWILKDNPNWSRKEIDAEIATAKRTTVRLARPIPVAWIYLTGWASPDGTINFRNDVYGLDAKPANQFMAQVDRPVQVSAARASGFVLQSAGETPLTFKDVSYLDNR